jgi:hypothetical protein
LTGPSWSLPWIGAAAGSQGEPAVATPGFNGRAMVDRVLAPHLQGTDTMLTGLLDRSALYGVLAQVEELGLDLVEVRQLKPERAARQAHDQTGGTRRD